MTKHVAIIGNGISGITAARHIRKKSDMRITVISSETDYFFSRTALMYVFMGHMKFQHTKPYEDWFWKKNKIDLLKAYIHSIDFEAKTLLYDEGELSYDILIIASGSQPSKFGCPGQDIEGVQGLYSYQDLQLMEENTSTISRAVIVGGGLIGVEMAEMLHSRNIPVSYLVREDRFWGNVLPSQEGTMIADHLKKHHVDLHLNTEIGKINGDENGRVKSVTLDNGEEISCEFVGLTAGVKPNIEFLRGSPLKINRGILINEYFETNVNDVFAIGDCAEHINPPEGRAKIEQLWYTGRIMGETLARNITGPKQEYNPGPWFNSAKFFDIEYQTYGTVRPVLGEGEVEYYWEHKKSEKCAHFIWEKNTRLFKGVNVMGIRWRHEIFDAWLKNKFTIDQVMDRLTEANFDPEFFTKYEPEIVKNFKSVVV